MEVKAFVLASKKDVSSAFSLFYLCDCFTIPGTEGLVWQPIRQLCSFRIVDCWLSEISTIEPDDIQRTIVRVLHFHLHMLFSGEG